MVKSLQILIVLFFLSCSDLSYKNCFKENTNNISEIPIDTTSFFLLYEEIGSDKYYNDEYLKHRKSLIENNQPAIKFAKNFTYNQFYIKENKYIKNEPIGYFRIINKDSLELCEYRKSPQSGWFVSRQKLAILNDSILIRIYKSNNNNEFLSFYKKVKN
jgi:hypothetical protein